MQRFQDLVRTLTPLIVPLIALILSGLLSYFVTVSTLDAKISVQERRLDAVEKQQDKTEQNRQGPGITIDYRRRYTGNTG